MNEEILEYLRGQFGDDYFNIDTQEALTDYENTVLRRGIMAGYDLGELQPALEQLRVELVKKKRKSTRGFSIFTRPLSTSSRRDWVFEIGRLTIRWRSRL